jgi:hypothetical protein
MIEAFVYLWYDALNKMYYLGKHKGSPDDTYTHSSTIWESFTKDNIPEGVTRRILAYGTDEEMCILENKLLINRKDRCWNRYYNESLGDPRYVDTSGENNPNWKNGTHVGRSSPDIEVRRAAERRRNENPKRKEQNKARDAKRANNPKRIAWKKAYTKAYYLRKKAERQGEGTLVAHIK